jgi:hypothetical protein
MKFVHKETVFSITGVEFNVCVIEKGSQFRLMVNGIEVGESFDTVAAVMATRHQYTWGALSEYEPSDGLDFDEDTKKLLLGIEERTASYCDEDRQENRLLLGLVEDLIALSKKNK